MPRKFIAILIVLAGACATSPAKIRESWQPWVGKPIDVLVSAWGPPSSTFTMPVGGGKIYTWLYMGETSTAVVNMPSINMALAQSDTEYCKVDWTTDQQGIVQSFRWDGQCKVKKLK